MSFDFFKDIGIPAEQTGFSFGRKFCINGSVGHSWQDIILSGVSPLTLLNAKRDGLNYVKTFGKTEQTNLPNGYVQKEYIQSSTLSNYNTKLDTGVMPEVGDVLEIIFTPLKVDTVSNYLLQSRYNSNGTIFGISGSQSDASIMATWGGVSVKAQSIVRQVNHKYYIKASFMSTGTTLYIKDLTTNEEETRSTELGEIEPSANYWLFGNKGGQTLQAVYYTYLVKITNGNRVKLHYLPAVYNTTEGFYDLVTNTLKQADTGRFYASQTNGIPTPDTPINIVSNNGIIKTSPNIFNKDMMVVQNTFIRAGNVSESSPLGSEVSNADWNCSTFIRVLPNVTYTLTKSGNSTAGGAGLVYYSSNDVSTAISGVSDQTQGSAVYTFTTPSNCNYIRFSWRKSYGNNEQLEAGSSATFYKAYGVIQTDGTVETITDSLGNTATAEMLLNVTITNSYTDVQEILTGVVTRNTAIKVLDGTEGWVVNSGDYNFYRLNSAVNYSGSLVSGFHCTHFEPVSIASATNNQGIRINSNSLFLRYDNLYPATAENLPLFKQWLATQYAKGTPVILVYPLATATTESVTGQTLSTKSGTNTIIATGSLPNLIMEVSYKAGVSVTITEIENANLSNNVSVEISNDN